jgi:hypothetical protein
LRRLPLSGDQDGQVLGMVLSVGIQRDQRVKASLIGRQEPCEQGRAFAAIVRVRDDFGTGGSAASPLPSVLPPVLPSSMTSTLSVCFRQRATTSLTV